MDEPASIPKMEYVGFWKRVMASVIDTIIIVIVALPLLLAFYGSSYFSSGMAVHGVADFVISYVLPAVFVVVCWRFRGATPGKAAISARIVDAATGGTPSTGQLVGRYFGYFVSIIPLGLGLLWVGLDRRKQGWHDKLVGTVVVYDDD